MSEVVQLKLAEKPDTPDAKEEMLKAFDDKVADMRARVAEAGAGGFLLLAYDRTVHDNKPTFSTWIEYFVTDPADCYLLPDMAKTRVFQRIHE